jgi:mannosyltransferase
VRVLRLLPVRASVLGLIGALVGWAGTATPSYEGDEAASIMSAERTIPNLFAMAGNVDAVHTAYYLFLHGWIRVFGTTELATRAPSAIAVGILVAGVVVLADRLGGARLGVVAGVLAIALPRVTHMAAEARSYAFAAAAVAWIGVLVVHLLRGRLSGRRAQWRWIALGVAIAAVSWVFLYCVLLVAVVGVAALVLRRDLWRRWLGMALTAAALASPMALIAYGQRGQLSPLLLRTAVTPESVLVTPWFMELWPAVVGGVLAVAAVVLTLVRRCDPTALVVALAGTVVPIGLLLLAGLVTPLYSSRYPAFCVAFVALLMAIGVVRIAELVPASRTRVRVATGTAVVVVAVVVAAPVYVAQRGPYGEVGAPDFRQAAEQVGQVAHPGDAVIFGVERPPISPRIALRLYPQHFTGLRDVQLDTPFFERTHLWDTVKPLRDVVPELGDRVIAIERVSGSHVPPDIALLTGLGYRVDTVRHVHHDSVYVLVRSASGAPAAVR